MPELPDVEDLRRRMAEHATGQRIERVEAPDAEILRNTSPQGLGRSISGSRFGTPERHGKWLLAHVDNGATVVLHFGMTGELGWAEHGDPRADHDHVVFVLEDGELRVNMQRKFGGVWLARGESEIEDITGPLGPDAAALDRDELAELLDGRRGGLKSALMDQELVAGIGNIVADEVLWHARLHPAAPVADLTDDDLDELHEALEQVLERSAEVGHVPRDEDLLTHARDVDDPSCPRCGTAVENVTVASRTTYLCPSCQPAP